MLQITWLMAREYSIWNTAIASLQFWTADLDPVTLGRSTEWVYTTFFYSPSSHTLHLQSDKTLFRHFVITLNAAFDQLLSLADEGYESASDAIDQPTPLRKTLRIHYVSSMEHASIQSSTCHTMQYTTNSTQTSTQMFILQLSRHTTLQTALQNVQKKMKKKDFQTVPLDDEQWTSEETPERTLCTHEHGLPHGLCTYPCPYTNYEIPSYMDSLDLSDISDYKDYMVTSSNEDIPAFEDTPYWERLWFDLNAILFIQLIPFLVRLNILNTLHS